MAKLESTKLAERVLEKFAKLLYRADQLRNKLAMPKFREEAIRKLELMESQLHCIRDIKGPAKQACALIWPKGSIPHDGDTRTEKLELTAVIIAPTRDMLDHRLANWARADGDCNIFEADVSDKKMLKALNACFVVQYVDALE